MSIKIEHTEVRGFEPAMRGARNAMNSWALSDSHYEHPDGDLCRPMFILGPKDITLLKNLAQAGPDHGKALRMIQVWCDITGPFYWYKELDTYRMGVEKNSCSTMHKLTHKVFEEDDFSCEHLGHTALAGLRQILFWINDYRDRYIETGDKSWWWQIIQLLPSSYNQRRTYMFSYASLRAIYHARKNHKLDEWHGFCAWVETLPYSELITS